jgi:hypothetical protein
MRETGRAAEDPVDLIHRGKSVNREINNRYLVVNPCKIDFIDTIYICKNILLFLQLLTYYLAQ